VRHPAEYIVVGAIGLVFCAAAYVCHEGAGFLFRDSGEPLRFRILAAVGIVVFTLGFIACWFLW
jgi:hypothetical protein